MSTYFSFNHISRVIFIFVDVIHELLRLLVFQFHTSTMMHGLSKKAFPVEQN